MPGQKYWLPPILAPTKDATKKASAADVSPGNTKPVYSTTRPSKSMIATATSTTAILAVANRFTIDAFLPYRPSCNSETSTPKFAEEVNDRYECPIFYPKSRKRRVATRTSRSLQAIGWR